MNTALLCGLVWSLFLLSVQGQRISERKCKDFRQIITTRASVIPLTLNPTPINFISLNCTKTVELIVGGEDAKPEEFPHQALLGYKVSNNSDKYDFKCGGSLISERYVLTAAHCMKFRNLKIVRLGEHNLNDDFDNQHDFDIKSIIKHPDYSYSRSYHDIALIELFENVKFSKAIRPACLWIGSRLNVTSVVATGFGSTETGGNTSAILQKVMLDVLDKQECVAQYKYQRGFTQKGVIDGQLCVGSRNGSKDACLGDSGGPIQVVTEPKGCIYHIIGVTSMGPGACGVGRSPSIYTQVASYISWIEKQVWPYEW